MARSTASEARKKSNLHSEPSSPTGSVDSIEFIDHEDFHDLSYDEATIYRGAAPMFADEDAFEFDSEFPILSPEGEAFLFRKMNYLKYRAHLLHQKSTLTTDEKRELEEHLRDARSARDQIARSCYRLARSIARNFATNDADFDELFGEANLILLKAISKFDVSKGFRFSTYATHSIQRHIFRWRKRARKRQMLSHSEHTLLEASTEADFSAVEDEGMLPEQAAEAIFSRLGECLNEREQCIIRQRFALDEDSQTKTLGDLATELGISSERVRQIQVGALQKLKMFFSALSSSPAGA